MLHTDTPPNLGNTISPVCRTLLANFLHDDGSAASRHLALAKRPHMARGITLPQWLRMRRERCQASEALRAGKGRGAAARNGHGKGANRGARQFTAVT